MSPHSCFRTLLWLKALSARKRCESAFAVLVSCCACFCFVFRTFVIYLLKVVGFSGTLRESSAHLAANQIATYSQRSVHVLQCIEVDIPPTLRYIAHRAFFDCEQLTRFTLTGKRTTWRGPYAESNSFALCSRFEIPKWINLLPPDGEDPTESDGQKPLSER